MRLNGNLVLEMKGGGSSAEWPQRPSLGYHAILKYDLFHVQLFSQLSISLWDHDDNIIGVSHFKKDCKC